MHIPNFRDPLDKFLILCGFTSLVRSDSLHDAMDTMLVLSMFPEDSQREDRQRVMDIPRSERIVRATSEADATVGAADRFRDTLSCHGDSVIFGQALSLAVIILVLGICTAWTLVFKSAWALPIAILSMFAAMLAVGSTVSLKMNKLLGTSPLPTIRVKDTDETP
jgi:hypothetical protein